MRSPYLCHLASDYRGAFPDGGMMVERKWDGFRCLFFRGIDGQPRLWSRNGMPIEGCDHILRQLLRVEQRAGFPAFIDGELVVDGTLAATKRWVETDYRQGGERGTFHAFDMLSQADWKAGGTDTPLYQRKSALAQAISEAGADRSDWDWTPGTRGRDESEPSPVELVEDVWVFSHADLVAEARRIWAIGGEGLMAKFAEEPYRRVRSGAWVKIKRDNMNKWSNVA